MTRNKAVIGGVLGGIGAALLGLVNISMTINQQELVNLLEVVSRYFMLFAYIILLYLYFILHKEHQECREGYNRVSKELHDLKDRLISLEHASKD